MMEPEQLAWLEDARLQDLRKEWEQRYGAAPRLRSPDLLRRMLAWRIQADTYGGLDVATRKRLAGQAGGAESLLAEGTVITREWRGEKHAVEVANDGFLYNGERWKSLSEVARAITGTRWNGPRFFGLRPAA